MLKQIAIPALIFASAVSVTAAVRPMLYEEQLARQEEGLIIQNPIDGIRNHFWFDYRANVNETQKELSSDLRHVSDTEDLRDAWEEYRHELAHNRAHYVKEMAERGHRYGLVIVGD
jgi:ABC-type phosphonate transport system ATPase subunit